MTMTDRELLEMAAKAAGYVVRWYDDSLAYGPTFGIEVEPGNPSGFEPWNPLEDDGDAFRLAVKLDLTIYGPGSHPGVLVKTADAHTTYSDDCVRRAIVLAAAAIGQAMQEKH
ncbi:hypothetical protein [Pseudomonas sp. NBRC 111130]|uniref:hypothetical protein n=1 Tax=Pseudomonas sp. NBRC 111130 TaxID=1661045 RepID=UPI0006D3B70C|nr:hypothetical protein [Pseudomonas sp. NBRC 111130]